MASQAFTSANGRPIASGIELVPTRSLPDRVRSTFPFPFFNAMQSRCFSTAYQTTDNFVVSAPTGSGKTAVLELAICRCAADAAPSGSGGFKIVYTAPTKALCAERRRDWAAKLSALGLRCEELTGDTDAAQLRHVQSADVIITTPEKWDSMTRRWRDHARLMSLVRLFLVDEVHILREDRGACLETVVSRMKTLGGDVRFIALSATIPNSNDIAKWLGRNASNQMSPAALEVFGESFRPVPLEKHVVGIASTAYNDFSFDNTCTQNLPDIIETYSKRKPILIFCMTRASTEKTAKALADLWLQSHHQDRLWPAPSGTINVSDEGLRECASASVAFHHAGIDMQDRLAVERAYLDGQISIICCTSTLAVGINLPCHLVIIKNTVSYNSATTACQEYSELDVMQMLGRAGRPQFDREATAVIMTRQEKSHKYERLVQGQEILESRLHLNLIEHLNAEVGLKTVQDLRSACAWLKSTFLFVRLTQNPQHYRLEGDAPGLDLDARAEEICRRAIRELERLELITGGVTIKSTLLGDAMSKFCICFETMRLIISLSHKARLSEILSVIAQAAEFKSIRLKGTEKQMFREINQSPMIRFPIRVNLDLPAQKISLIIQAVLSGLQVHDDERFAKLRRQYNVDVAHIFQHAGRIAKCIVECQLAKEDSESMRNSMELSRSLGAEAWDDSPLQLAQIEKLGPVAVRRLTNANIRSIEDLENTEPSRIEMALSRNPPFGFEILAKVEAFPKLRVSLKCIGRPTRSNDHVGVQIRAELGFLNETPPATFNKSPLKISFLAETSDGRVVHFCRMSGRDLGSGHEAAFQAKLQASHQLVNGYISCDDLAGTLRYATLDPKVPASMFDGLPIRERGSKLASTESRISIGANENQPGSRNSSEEYDKDLDDEDLSRAVEHTRACGSAQPTKLQDRASKLILAGTGKPRTPTKIDLTSATASAAPFATSGGGSSLRQTGDTTAPAKSEWKPARLPNGNWKCNHRCKNKMTCNHKCCQEGTENKPKPPKVLGEKVEEYQHSSIYLAMKQRQDASVAIRQTLTPAASRPTESDKRREVNERLANSPFDDIDDIPSEPFDEEAGLNEVDIVPATQIRSGQEGHLFVSSSPEKAPEATHGHAIGSSTQKPKDDARKARDILKRKFNKAFQSPEEISSRRTSSFHPEFSFVDGRKRFLIPGEDDTAEPAERTLFSDVDFGPACVSDEDLFPNRVTAPHVVNDDADAQLDVDLQHHEQEPVSVSASLFKSPCVTRALNSECPRQQQPSDECAAEEAVELTLEEIDAFLMERFGNLINFI